jgi:poly-gamma-glutamate capsule biosynthesis protein CapA/YwtB (metallophosphatase superfamily)
MSDAQAVTLAAVGDIHIDRVPPEGLMRHVADEIRSADIRFANSEQMFSQGGCPDPHHATFSHPRNIPALQEVGFDVVSLANNHTMDWGAAALLDSIERLESAGIRQVGAGPDMAAARKPVIIERKGVKVGFLAYNCTGPDGFEATSDKPGNAAVRIWTIYDKWDYQPATPPQIISMARKDDLAAMCEDVAALARSCDVCVVSFHWGQHYIPRVIPDYCFEVGRAAVDAGAHLILGGHPHMLKGAEMYKGRAIFYSLGNFAFEQGAGPEKYRGTTRMKALVKKHYKVTPLPYPTHAFHPDGLATLIVKAKISPEGRIDSVSFVPCYINPQAEPEIFRRGDARGDEVFDYMSSISASEGLAIEYAWNAEGTEVLLQAKPGGPDSPA